MKKIQFHDKTGALGVMFGASRMGDETREALSEAQMVVQDAILEHLNFDISGNNQESMFRSIEKNFRAKGPEALAKSLLQILLVQAKALHMAAGLLQEKTESAGGAFCHMIEQMHPELVDELYSVSVNGPDDHSKPPPVDFLPLYTVTIKTKGAR